MTHTFYLLLAAGTLGAPPGDAASPGTAATSGSAAPYQQPVTSAQDVPVHTGPIREWVRNLFGQKKPAAVTKNTTVPATPISKGEASPMVRQVQYQTAPCTAGCSPRAANPSTPCSTGSCSTVDTRPVQQVKYSTTPAPTVATPESSFPALADLRVAKKYEDQVGHEPDYRWVTGHLFFVYADGGRWVVRYGLPGEVDKFGGSVILAPGVEMRNYRDGDLVCVYGDVLDEGRTVRSLGGALYRVNVISIVDRSDP
jgi:hypothetical protein